MTLTQDPASAISRFDTPSLRLAVEAISEGFILHGRDGSIQFWNESAEEILGLTGEQLSGKTSFDEQWHAIHEDGSPFPGETHPAAIALRTGEIVRDVIMGVCRGDGSRRWIRVSAKPLVLESGEQVGAVATFADITELLSERQAHAETAQQLQLAVSSSLTGLWDWDIDSGHASFSDTWTGMIGYEPHDVAPNVQSWEELLHPDDREKVRNALEEHFSGRDPSYRAEFRLRTKKGAYRWILAAGAVVKRDTSGRPLRMVGTHVDINETKAAEQRFRRVFEASSDPLVIVQGLTIVDCNQAAVRILSGNDRADIIGRRAMDFSVQVSRRDRVALGHASRDLYAQEPNDPMRFEWRVRALNGRVFDSEVGLAPIILDGQRAIVVAFRDLTERNRYQRELLTAKNAAESANRAKSDFLARMSHELRTPLNSIIGFSRLLLRRRPGEVSGSGEYLERIHANGVHLLGVINDILDLSRIESGKMHLDDEDTSLETLVRATVAQLEDQAREKGIALRLLVPDGLLPIHTDVGKVRQILINLIGNAIKFTSSGEVSVTLEGSLDGKPIALAVRDSGIGIAEDRLTAIFEPFEQGETTIARRFGGTGLGLAISRQLCQLLGFTLEAQSALGKGSTFRVRFERLPNAA